MRRVRVIPTLLLNKGRLVKSIKFKKYAYLGDPINAVKIFNEKEVDEICIIDITATANKTGPNIPHIREIASEAFMPLAYGGGISKVEEVRQLVNAGVEKIILNYNAFHNPQLIRECSQLLGSQSVVGSIDVKKDLWGRERVYLLNGTKNTGLDPLAYAEKLESLGVGEIILNSIDNDGTFGGYDCNLVKKVSAGVSVPVVALGGAGSVADFRKAVQSGASAVSAGSMFVFQRPHRAVLISYPTQLELEEKVFNELLVKEA
jgi:imidazole glycerol-phosphate synthase subunit HisF